MNARRTVVGLATVGLVAAILAAVAPGPAAGSAAAASVGTAGAAAQSASGDPPGTWWYDALGLDEAHASGATGEGVVVGVIDSIVDPTVPELAGADVVPAFNACRMADPDATPQQAFGSGTGTSHGTAMTSLIVGTGSGNGPTGGGTRGIAPDATVRVYAMDELSGDQEGLCTGRSSPLLAERVDAVFERAIADGVDIINFSAHLTAAGSIDDILAEAGREGIVVVAAAGNDGLIEYPASRSAELGVVAVNPVGPAADIPPWSPRDQAVVVAAPGLEMLVGTATIDGWQSEVVSGGSSNATAVVSGALAVVKSRYPEATGSQLVQHLVRHTTDDELRHDPGYGFGILALQEMLASDPTAWQDVNPLTRVSSLPALPEEYPDAAARGDGAPPRPSRTGDEPTAAESVPAAAPSRPESPSADPTVLWLLGGGAALVTLVVVGGAVLASARERQRRARVSELSVPAAIPGHVWGQGTSRGGP